MLHTSQIKRTLYGLLSLRVPHRVPRTKVRKPTSRKPSEALSQAHASCDKHTWARRLVFMVRVSADTRPQGWQLLQEALVVGSLVEQKWMLLPGVVFPWILTECAMLGLKEGAAVHSGRQGTACRCKTWLGREGSRW